MIKAYFVTVTWMTEAGTIETESNTIPREKLLLILLAFMQIEKKQLQEILIKPVI